MLRQLARIIPASARAARSCGGVRCYSRLAVPVQRHVAGSARERMGHAFKGSTAVGFAPLQSFYRPFSSYPDHTLLEMPALSPSMEEGNLVSWSIKEGDAFVAGDVIAEIETDKAMMSWEATDDGVLAKILVPAGSQGVSIGQVVAVVVEEDTDISAFKEYEAPQGDAAAESTESSSSSSEDPPPPAESDAPPKPSVQQSSVTPPAPIVDAAGERVKASPRARKLAKEQNIDLSTVSGTGPGGRITESDVQSAYSGARSSSDSSQQAAPPKPMSDGEDFTDEKVSNIRKVIARRLLESKNTIPHYYLTADMQVDELLSLRKTLNDRLGGEKKISVNDFVIKASSLALKKVPEVNSAWLGEEIRRFHNVHINVAVSTDNGLYSPLIQNVQNKGLVDINDAVNDLAVKARSNKLHANELQSGTFTISNLGMFGIKSFTAVINPPQACILACGGLEGRVVPKGDEFAVANYLTVTLSCDHRVVDGAVGAQWLKHFKTYMENPMTMLL